MSKGLIRFLVVGLCVVLVCVAFTGCAKRKHRKIQVIEEQREGEVIEQAHGQQMIVE